MEKKEAMKILKDFYDKSALFSVRTALDTIIPELKENEDERIRKEIIDYINKATGCERWITWLKNHSEKPQGKTALEAIKEEKVDNANKVVVEPKFKIKDWIVNTITNDVEQIIDITNNEYICTGLLIVSFENQHLLKKWTIQDARNGDVLVDDTGIILFDKIGNKHGADVISYYCYVNRDSKFIINPCENYWGTINDSTLRPANNIERKFLFKKMKEAGYETIKVIKRIKP